MSIAGLLALATPEKHRSASKYQDYETFDYNKLDLVVETGGK